MEGVPAFRGAAGTEAAGALTAAKAGERSDIGVKSVTTLYSFETRFCTRIAGTGRHQYDLRTQRNQLKQGAGT